jgi:hypothetical protein
MLRKALRQELYMITGRLPATERLERIWSEFRTLLPKVEAEASTSFQVQVPDFMLELDG